MKHILVATDLTARSDRAIERAFSLARETGAELTILHAVDDELPASVADQIKGEKLTIFKKRRRKNYRRTRGHRQLLTVLKVTEILPDGRA